MIIFVQEVNPGLLRQTNNERSANYKILFNSKIISIKKHSIGQFDWGQKVDLNSEDPSECSKILIWLKSELENILERIGYTLDELPASYRSEIDDDYVGEDPDVKDLDIEST